MSNDKELQYKSKVVEIARMLTLSIERHYKIPSKEINIGAPGLESILAVRPGDGMKWLGQGFDNRNKVFKAKSWEDLYLKIRGLSTDQSR